MVECSVSELNGLYKQDGKYPRYFKRGVWEGEEVNFVVHRLRDSDSPKFLFQYLTWIINVRSTHQKSNEEGKRLFYAKGSSGAPPHIGWKSFDVIANNEAQKVLRSSVNPPKIVYEQN